jgi:predicted esterase
MASDGRHSRRWPESRTSSTGCYQYWFVQKSAAGRYDLACYLARIGQIDAAFYWLLSAAIQDGVDAPHAQRDADLVSLRSDARWERVRDYLVQCNRYFELASIARTTLILPKDYRKSTSIPAIVWLHGLGANPDGFVSRQSQGYADKLNVALIGVSGTNARGPRSFVWAEVLEKDAKRVRDALVEVSDRVTVKKGQLITFGFSQGAQVGLEIAIRFPEEFAGSIALSPGAQSHLDTMERSPLLIQRGFIISCGANEHPGNVQLTARDAEWLGQANAHVIHKTYPGVSAHAFPQDFTDRFPEWVRFILKSQSG